MNRLTRIVCMTVAVVWAVDLARANVVSPGFEQGPNISEVSFTPNDVDNLGWFASNTDGERFKSTVSKPAAEGDFYASMLQNSGKYNGAPLGIGDFGFMGFDRVYATFSVLPNTTYLVEFQHAGDDRYGYYADTSVVEVVNADTNSTITQFFAATPGLFAWKKESFSFTTGPVISNAAIAFTVLGAANTSGVFDDVRIIPEPATVSLLALGSLVALRRRRR